MSSAFNGRAGDINNNHGCLIQISRRLIRIRPLLVLSRRFRAQISIFIKEFIDCVMSLLMPPK